jgi:hypothetical protein
MPIAAEQSPEESARPGRRWLFVPLVLLVLMPLLILVPLLDTKRRHHPVDLRLGPMRFYAGTIDNDVYWNDGLTLHRRPLDPSHDGQVWCGVR